MKRLNPSGSVTCSSPLQVTNYRVIEPELPHHTTTSDRGLVTAFCGLVWAIALVASVGYVAGVSYHYLQRIGGQANVTR